MLWTKIYDILSSLFFFFHFVISKHKFTWIGCKNTKKERLNCILKLVATLKKIHSNVII